MWLLLGFILLVFALIGDYLNKSRRYRILKSSGIPGPAYTLPFIGDAIETIGNDTLNIFALFARLGDQFGKVYRLWLLDRLLIIVRDPKYFEAVFSSQQLIKKPFLYRMFGCWLGDGLLLSCGSKWHTRRKILTPAYHFKILEQFVEVFDRQSRIFVKKLASKADGKTAFNIFPIVCLLSLDNIAKTAMGVEINAQEHPEFPYANAVKTATNILATRNVKPIQYYDIGFLLTAFPSFLQLRKSIKIMHDFTNKVINDRRATTVWQKNATEAANDLNDLDVGQKTRMAFLDILLQATIDGKPLSQEDIREEVDTFMFEGHDTTTSGISFCLYMLSRHAHIQQKAYEEIIQLLGPAKDTPVDMRNLKELKYLEAVIKESLRMFPSVPMIGREAVQDFKIGDQVIPANSNIVLLLYGAGRDEDYFPKPHEFNPERFYSEPIDSINPFAYVPFSAGPRNCIGQKFAMLEMKSVITHVLREYELLPLGEDVLLISTLILRSLTGVQIGLRKRT